MMPTLAKVCRYLYDSPDRVAPYVPLTCPRARQSKAYHIGYMEGRAEGMREAAAYVAQWARSGLACRVWEALAPVTAIGSAEHREGLTCRLVRSIVGGKLGSLVTGGVPSPETKGHDPALYQSTCPEIPVGTGTAFSCPTAFGQTQRHGGCWGCRRCKK